MSLWNKTLVRKDWNKTRLKWTELYRTFFQEKSNYYSAHNVGHNELFATDNKTDDPMAFLDQLVIKEEDFLDEENVQVIDASCHLPDLRPSHDDELLNFLTSKVDNDFLADFQNAGQPSRNDFLNDLATTSTVDVRSIKTDPDILTDCMWSAAVKESLQLKSNKGRKRDVSLTLSECAEGITSIASMDLDFLGTTPPSGGILDGSNLIWTPLNQNSETETDSEEEEIDVVTAKDDDVTPWVEQRRAQSVQSIQPGKKVKQELGTLETNKTSKVLRIWSLNRRFNTAYWIEIN